MASHNDTQHVNLAAGGWPGIDLRSKLKPMPQGQFLQLDNCYVSSDRTQLRRVPGYRKIAEPRFEEAFAIASAPISTNPSTITLTNNHDAGTAVTDTFQVRITGSDALPDINGTHTATWASVNSFTIPIAITTGSTALNHGVAHVFRAREIHGYKQVHNHLVAIGEFSPKVAQAAVQDVYEISPGTATRLTINRPHGYDVGETFTVTTSAGGGPTNPAIPNAAYTATAIAPYEFTIPHTTTVGDSMAGTGVLPPHNVAFAAKISALGAWVHQSLPTLGSTLDDFIIFYPSVWKNFGGVMGLQDFSFIRKRSALEVSDRRVMIATPGYGCCFQVDIGNWSVNAALNEVFALGTPKGLIDLTTATATTGGSLADTTYYVAVAYRTSETEGFGLMSKPFSITTAGGNISTITVQFASPWEVLRELPTVVTVQCYIGTAETGLRLVDSQVSAVDLGTNPTPFVITALPAAVDTRDLTIEQMPMGAKFLRTMRGQTIFGGTQGTHGLLSDHFRINTDITHSGAPAENRDVEIARTTELVGGHVFPPAYQGLMNLYNPPRGTPKIVNMQALTYYDPGAARHQWRTDWNSASGAGLFETEGKGIPAQGVIQVSEQGFPFVTPSSYNRIVEAHVGDDTEGAARFGNGWIIATDRELFSYTFQADPRASDPMRVSDDFGCNGSPNAMFEAEGFAGGVGHRGPWIFGDGVSWIGEPVYNLFKTFKADSQGYMRHSIASYDDERRVVWFGFRESGTNYDSVDDGRKGKVGCDKFLIYSIGAQAWTTWTVPSHLGQVWWMERVKFSDGQIRMTFLGGATKETAAIYVFDDEWLEGIESVVTSGVDTAFLGATSTFVCAFDRSATAKVGMSYLIKRGNDHLSDGIIQSVSTTSIGLESTVTLQADDAITIGQIPVTIQAQAFPSLDPDGKLSINKIQLRGENVGGEVNTGAAFTATMRTDSEGLVGAIPSNVVTISNGTISGTRGSAERGMFDAEDIDLTIKVLSSSSWALKDIFVEMGPGG